uniref:Uncharacterized protein n=1 Tax=Physcomitrium patens TaxID=3218 RepID=A0A7I4AXN6_PHYPA
MFISMMKVLLDADEVKEMAEMLTDSSEIVGFRLLHNLKMKFSEFRDSTEGRIVNNRGDPLPLQACCQRALFLVV